jgi:hypothetical protein
MPIPTLIVEDGSVVAGANTYISLADAQAYFDARLYSTVWNSAGTNQTVSLVNATTLIDQLVQFYGLKKTSTQSLQWPRERVRDPDIGSGGYGFGSITPWIPDNVVPKRIKDCVCEVAISLLKKDRTAEVAQKGIKHVGLGKGAIDTDFDRLDVPKPITDYINAVLSPYGMVRGDSINAKIIRA